MADCSGLFLSFNASIRLDDPRREMLRKTRNNLRQHIQTQFKIKHPNEQIELIFQSQGSYVMDTIIRPLNDQFDLDDGLYFNGVFSKDDNTPKVVHDWVMDTIDTHSEFESKDTCIRIVFPEDKFHLDVPIYHNESNTSPFLAHKQDGWKLSGPVEFIFWFETKIQSGFLLEYFSERKLNHEKYRQWQNDIRKKDVQLRRIVRYLKAWGNFKEQGKKNEMPPGIVMTILAAENYVPDQRDDISFYNTLLKTKDWLKNNNNTCPRPTTPKGEDLFKKYGGKDKQYFFYCLDNLILSASQAINSPNQKEACLKWQNHLGSRFPCHLAIDSVEGSKTYSSPGIIGDTAKSAQ